MDMNSVEKQALITKLNNPNEDVKCPRCGNVIVRKNYGNSVIVECATTNCIHGGIRGI